MPKIVEPLGALAVSKLEEPGYHAVGGVRGLYLQIGETADTKRLAELANKKGEKKSTDEGEKKEDEKKGGGNKSAKLARSWILRIRIGKKRREIGLGPFNENSLAEARMKAKAMRDKVAAGIDPVLEKRAARSALVAAKAKQRNFRDIAEDYIEVKSPEWTNAKHAAQWTNTLTEYAYPILGQLLVEDIEAAHIVRVLKPLWDGKKVETGTRLRQRIEKIIDYAIAQGIRTNKENPAMWRGRLIHMLPAPGKIRTVVHHAAMPLQQLGAFMVELRKREGMGAKALDFLTMTAARSGEVRFATWAEIDLKAKLWTVPAEHMKAGEEHRVPLSDQAVALLEAMPRHAESQVIFYSGTGRELSDMTLTKCLRDMGHAATPHGMRSCFRDWASERGYSRELAERALAHAVGSKVEAAYLRTKAVEARRPMMQSWSDFLDRVQPVEGNVADMDAARKKAAA